MSTEVAAALIGGAFLTVNTILQVALAHYLRRPRSHPARSPVPPSGSASKSPSEYVLWKSAQGYITAASLLVVGWYLVSVYQSDLKIDGPKNSIFYFFMGLGAFGGSLGVLEAMLIEFLSSRKKVATEPDPVIEEIEVLK